MSKPLDLERSKQIAKQIKVIPKQIFENTYKAALRLENALYIQGFLVVVGNPKPKEYSWLELEDCTIDVNLPKENSGERFYFPAQQLSLSQLKIAIAEAKEDYPEDDPLPIYGSEPYEYYGEALLGGKEYQSAYEAAMEKLGFNSK
jgi:hypothetical protein